MTTPTYELVVTLLDGDAREVGRTFEAGTAQAPFSVGLRGDWVVLAEGVASVHLWLEFDGQRLYGVCAAGETAYVQDVRLHEGRHEIPDLSELRFGRARMKVLRRAPGFLRSSTPEADVTYRAEPRGPAARAEPSPLSPIERAAALPLPSFFNDRRGSRVTARPATPEPHRARSHELPGSTSRLMTPVSGSSLRSRQAVPKWPLVAIPALLLPLLAAFLWLIGSRGHRPPSEAPPAPSSVAPSSVAAGSTTRLERPFAEVPLPNLPALEANQVLPVVTSHVPLPKPAVLKPAVSNPAVSNPAISSSAVSNPAVSNSAIPLPQKAYRQDVTDKPVPRIGAEPWTISEEWRAHHERQLHAPNRATAKIIFLGDSITEGWGMAPAYQSRFGPYKPLNLGISGDFTQNVLWRIEQGALAGTNPEVLVLMIGVNNLAGGFSPKETVSGIRAILAAVQTRLPKTQVLLLAILPARQSPADPLRARISEANGLLAALPGLPRVSVHDVGSVLLEPDGSLSKTTTRDFLHPTPVGYERLSEAVAPLIDALLGQATE